MSLDVSPALLEQAERGEVDEADFIDCVRTSLPYAWEMISSLAVQLKVDGGEFADNQTPPPMSRRAASCCAHSRVTRYVERCSGISGCAWHSRTATVWRSSRWIPRSMSGSAASPRSGASC